MCAKSRVFVRHILVLCCCLAAIGGGSVKAKGLGDGHFAATLVSFPDTWNSPYHVDPNHPFHLVNAEGQHLFIVNKTAWLYLGCKLPEAVLERAVEQGVNTLRVGLEGRYYYETVGIDLWPWGGDRSSPIWAQFNERYWDQVERRIQMAGERGIGFDIVLYCTLKPTAEQIVSQQPYWAYVLQRLSKYTNILTWEIANEYLGNETFQKAVADFFRQNDPYHRPICTSAGTTDDAAWPDRPWLDLAINHTCTSSSSRHDLRDWYLAVARNTRAHGKPAFCNESGRENRHGNNDGVHRRKQGWLWCSAGCFWTWHSWDGCEGIDQVDYKAPGQEFLKPMADFFRGLPFWTLNPNYTALTISQPDPSAALGAGLVWATLAQPDRSLVVTYICSRSTGQPPIKSGVTGAAAQLRLPNGKYEITFQKPADLVIIEMRNYESGGIGTTNEIALPQFQDDLVITVRKVEKFQQAPARK